MGAEAEYRARAQGMCEGLWIKSLLEEVGEVVEVRMRLYCDNQAAIHIANNPLSHNRTKHIEVDCHFIKRKD